MPVPGVERALVAGERDEPAHALAESVGALVREPGKPLGGGGEPPANSVRFGHVRTSPFGPVRPASSPP